MTLATVQQASLADLQTERERLRAARARDAYDAALASTVAHADVMAAAMACRDVMLRHLDDLFAQIPATLAGSSGETLLHQELTDLAITSLRRMGDACARVSAACPAIGDSIRRGARPRDRMTVSEWADRNRWLLSGTNVPGRWSTRLVPYMRDVMDDLSEHSPARQVTLMKSAGVSGTESILNWLGYIMAHLRNKDVLLVVPTLELRDRSFNPRITKLIAETPVLAELASAATRDKSNRADLLEFGARARLIKAGSNSPDSLRADHLPYVVCDEVDAFPWEVGAEGDPMTLIENRQRTFSRAKTYLVSTPTVEGRSRIHAAWLRSDQRRYFVPCPHCGSRQFLEFGGRDTAHGLKWRVAPPEADTGEVQGRVDIVLEAWYACNTCHGRIEEGHKTAMLGSGVWIPARPQITLYRGYHLNALYAPIGLGLTWKQIAQKWLSCQGDSAELKAFVNTYLGEVSTEEGDTLETGGLQLRLEAYTRATLPLALVTAGVDVQKDRLEITLCGWGEGEQAWLLDHEVLAGETTDGAVWDALGDYLAAHDVQAVAIDAGYRPQMVYDFCARRAWAYATKGITGPRPLIEDEKKRRARLRLRRKKGHTVEPLGVDGGKALLYARLKQTAPGPGYIHFPALPPFDDEYFAQLGAEKLVRKFKGGRPFEEWVQTRPRNEALDCLLLALAAARLSGRPLEPRAPALPKPGSANPPVRVSSALR